MATASDELRVLHPWLSEEAFSEEADSALEHLQNRLEAYVEEQDVEGADVEMGQGVLTVKLGEHGTYVINKQTPNRQLWLSSPVSGPMRFDYTTCGRWIYSRDGRDLVHMLQREVQDMVGTPLDLER